MQIGQSPRVKAAFDAPRKAMAAKQAQEEYTASSVVTVDTTEAEKTADNVVEDISSDSKEERENIVHPKAEKKYSEDDVDTIVQRRLAREREKFRKMLDEEQYETELQKRERNITYRERKAEAVDLLAKDKLPVKLAEILDYSTEETAEKSYKYIKDAFNEAVQEQLKIHLRGNVPRGYHSEGFAADDIKGAFAPKVDDKGFVLGSAERIPKTLRPSGSI